MYCITDIVYNGMFILNREYDCYFILFFSFRVSLYVQFIASKLVRIIHISSIWESQWNNRVLLIYPKYNNSRNINIKGKPVKVK